MTNLDGVEAWDPREPMGLVPECSYCGLPLDDDGKCPGCGLVTPSDDVDVENFESGMGEVWDEG